VLQSVLQGVAVCVAGCCSLCCRVLQSVLQGAAVCVAGCCSLRCRVLQSVLQGAAVCVAGCCSLCCSLWYFISVENCTRNPTRFEKRSVPCFRALLILKPRTQWHYWLDSIRFLLQKSPMPLLKKRPGNLRSLQMVAQALETLGIPRIQDTLRSLL